MRKIDYSFSENKIVIARKTHVLPSKIEKVLEYRSRLIVLIDFMPPEIDRSVFCFSSTGDFLWQIQAVPGHGEAPKVYSAIFISDEGKLRAYHMGGADYDVSIEDGSVSLVMGPDGKPPRPW